MAQVNEIEPSVQGFLDPSKKINNLVYHSIADTTNTDSVAHNNKNSTPRDYCPIYNLPPTSYNSANLRANQKDRNNHEIPIKPVPKLKLPSIASIFPTSNCGPFNIDNSEKNLGNNGATVLQDTSSFHHGVFPSDPWTGFNGKSDHNPHFFTDGPHYLNVTQDTNAQHSNYNHHNLGYSPFSNPKFQNFNSSPYTHSLNTEPREPLIPRKLSEVNHPSTNKLDILSGLCSSLKDQPPREVEQYVSLLSAYLLSFKENHNKMWNMIDSAKTEILVLPFALDPNNFERELHTANKSNISQSIHTGERVLRPMNEIISDNFIYSIIDAANDSKECLKKLQDIVKTLSASSILASPKNRNFSNVDPMTPTTNSIMKDFELPRFTESRTQSALSFSDSNLTRSSSITIPDQKNIKMELHNTNREYKYSLPIEDISKKSPITQNVFHLPKSSAQLFPTTIKKQSKKRKIGGPCGSKKRKTKTTTATESGVILEITKMLSNPEKAPVGTHDENTPMIYRLNINPQSEPEEISKAVANLSHLTDNNSDKFSKTKNKPIIRKKRWIPGTPMLCAQCGRERTVGCPEWRTSIYGDGLVCNACGIFSSKLASKEKLLAPFIIDRRRRLGVGNFRAHPREDEIKVFKVLLESNQK